MQQGVNVYVWTQNALKHKSAFTHTLMQKLEISIHTPREEPLGANGVPYLGRGHLDHTGPGIRPPNLRLVDD